MNKRNYAEEGDPMYNWSDPKRVGRGVWYTWMLISYHSEEVSERLALCSYIRLFSQKFKCMDCRNHCQKYIEENPPESVVENRYGLFNWVITFMNAVNLRIGKPLYDRALVLREFREDFQFCNSGCGEKKEQSESSDYSVSQKPPPKRRSYNQDKSFFGFGDTRNSIYPKYSSSSRSSLTRVRF